MNNSDMLNLEVSLDEPLLPRDQISNLKSLQKLSIDKTNQQMSPQVIQNPSNLQSTYGAFITTMCTKDQEQEEGVTTDDPVCFTRTMGLHEEDK